MSASGTWQLSGGDSRNVCSPPVADSRRVRFRAGAKVVAFLFVFVLSFISGSVWLYRFVSSVLFMA